MSIDKFRTIDSTDTKHCFVRDTAKYGRKFFAKVSGPQSRRGLAINEKVDLLQRFSSKIINCKPDVLRGKERGSENLAYIVDAFRTQDCSLDRVYEILVCPFSIKKLHGETPH